MGKFFNQISSKLLSSHGYAGEEWAMSFAERFALSILLQSINPKTSIEIGTLHGGSLSVIANYSKKVYSLDINAESVQRLKRRHANVEYVCGDSSETLPKLLEKIKSDPINFVLIDGDHSTDGVKRDIENILTYNPPEEMFILMHDSFNPDCRKAIKESDWEKNKHVKWIDYDFIPGFINSIPGWEGEMWCGFALAYLSKEIREDKIEYDELLGFQFNKVLPISPH